MSKKDPAFLFYPKDWLQGTAELMPEEKGVYIDLLCHQHQGQSLPNDTKRLARMCGLPEQDFLPIWETLKHKFVSQEGNRLVNQKLTDITTERLTKGITNTITGTFASVIRLSEIPWDLKEKIKKEFKIDVFLTVPKEKLTERLTEWLLSRLPNGYESIGNGNGIINKGDARGRKKIDKDIFGTKFTEDGLCVVLSDGQTQPLGKNQKIRLKHDDIKPEEIWKNYIT